MLSGVEWRAAVLLLDSDSIVKCAYNPCACGVPSAEGLLAETRHGLFMLAQRRLSIFILLRCDVERKLISVSSRRPRNRVPRFLPPRLILTIPSFSARWRHSRQTCIVRH
jgi:hypothetical protein